MKKKLDIQLVEACPNLYRDRYKSFDIDPVVLDKFASELTGITKVDIRTTAMTWGFECADGWFEVLKEASLKLEVEILQLPEEDRSHYKATQIKEKYGTLQIYMSAETDSMSKIIEEAEDKSETVCECCGEIGKLRTDLGWISTLCDKHHMEKIETVYTGRAVGN